MTRLRDLVLGLLAVLAIAAALWQLGLTTRGLEIRRATVGTTPVTIFRPAGGAPAPVVVIAHGFAGSQQLMQPFAVTLARNGYVAVTFDFLGHGRNPVPAAGDINHVDGTTMYLLTQVGEVVAFARTLPGLDGRLALLGHSMADDVLVRYAEGDPSVAAIVAVSMFSPAVTASEPRNLLVVVGEGEPFLKREALRVLRLSAGEAAQPGVTYGSFADGSARRVAFAPHVEHASVLYSTTAAAESAAWLNAVFERPGTGYVDGRGPWIALLLAGIILLAKPLADLLPRFSETPLGAGLPWQTLLPVAGLPAVLTPLILWKAPTDFLPILVGDYLAIHFAVYGVLVTIGLWAVRRRKPNAQRSSWPGSSRPSALLFPSWPDIVDARANGNDDARRTTAKTEPHRIGLLLLAAALVALYSIGAFGLALDTYVISFVPIPERWPILIALFLGTLPFFMADEWLARGAGAPRGAYPVTKILFVLSIALAIALNVMKLFFLILIVPVILLFFVIYGLFSRFVYARTHHPLVGALANALAFAWAIAVTFPLIPR